MTGLFFCLASDTVQGFSFCPAAYKPRTSVYSALCIIHTIYTARTSKAFTGLYSGVSVNLTHSSAHNTVATQAVYTPHEPRWRAYHQTQYSHRYQIQPPRRTLYRAGQPPIIIRYIRAQGRAPVMNPCQPVQHTADHTSPAGSAPAVWGSLASADTLSAIQTRRTC